MIRKPFDNELEQSIYSQSDYDPYGLNKKIEEIHSSDWGEDIHSEYKSDSFDEKYLNQVRFNEGYLLHKNSHSPMPTIELGSNDPLIVKWKKKWDSKGFMYKFFVLDIFLGIIFELYIHLIAGSS